MADKSTMVVEVPSELYEKSKEEATRLGISLAGFVRQLMVQYFEKKG
jgi:hypothetical protein